MKSRMPTRLPIPEWIKRLLGSDWERRELRIKWRFPILVPAFTKDRPKPSKRAPAFDPGIPTPITHREKDTEEEDWVATPWNGTIPVLFAVSIIWGLSEKWMRTLPCPNDGEFGPMRYANNPDARYWGNYRADIQPRKGRRHLSAGY